MDRSPSRSHHDSLLTLGRPDPDDQVSCRKRPRPGGGAKSRYCAPKSECSAGQAELLPDKIAQRQHITDFLTTTDGPALTRAFTRIKDPRLHRGIIRLVEKSPAAVNHIRIRHQPSNVFHRPGRLSDADPEGRTPTRPATVSEIFLLEEVIVLRHPPGYPTVAPGTCSGGRCHARLNEL
jgi:hypothetical protein